MPRVKSVILYYSHQPNDKMPTVPLVQEGGALGFVRYEVVEADMVDALDLAVTLPGEIVLNAVPLFKGAEFDADY